MSSGKTANLKMHSWAASDAVVRSEFNENFNLIDSAVGTINSTLDGMSSTYGTCSICTGSYAGTGEKTFSLHFNKLPAIIFIHPQNSADVGVALVKENVHLLGSGSTPRLEISGNTINFVSHSDASFNYERSKYNYAALVQMDQ